MLVPFLVVVLRVLDDVAQEPPERLTPKQAAPRVFHTMFSQVMVLSHLAVCPIVSYALQPPAVIACTLAQNTCGYARVCNRC